MKIILNGQPTLAARFAELDKESHLKKKAKISQSEEKLPPGVKKIIKIPNFFKSFMEYKEQEQNIA